jgi:hypothetical protein
MADILAENSADDSVDPKAASLVDNLAGKLGEWWVAVLVACLVRQMAVSMVVVKVVATAVSTVASMVVPLVLRSVAK